MSSRQPGSYGLSRGRNLLDAYDDEEALLEADARQCDIDELSSRCQDEVAQVERKYNLLKKQHLLKRDAALRKIPSFWFNAFVNHPTVSSLMKDEDSMVLTFMSSLEVEDLPEGEVGFKITFRFLENPYLGNKELTKLVSVENGVLHCEATPIVWKDSAKSMNMAWGGFFGWFTGEDDGPGHQKSVAIAIAEDLWNNPLKYYRTPTIEIWDEDSTGVVADSIDAPMQEVDVPADLEPTIAETPSLTDRFREENSFESITTSGESLTRPTNGGT